MSIRVRVTLVTVILVALALVAADFTAYALLRSAIYRDAGASVRRLAATAVTVVEKTRQLDTSILSYADRAVLVRLVTSDGRTLGQVATQEGARRKLPTQDLLKAPQRPQVLPNQRIDAVAVPAGDGESVIAAVSLGTTATVLAELSRLNQWIGLAVIALSAVAAAVVLTFSLRPLRRIAETADAIAAGDLGERAPEAPSHSELARVGAALNRMLDEIQAAFAQRDATESRLRHFLADASHELRTPLTSIRGYAELFGHGADRHPEDLEHALRAIEAEASRMSRLVDELLMLARLDEERPLKLEPVAVDEVVRAAVDAANVVRDGRPISCEIARPIVVAGDAAALRRVIDNLLVNARRHTPPGTDVWVRLHQTADQAVLTVADAGPGIPTADRERIFDRFFRPDGGRSRDRGGAGLGLAIVRAIVTAHHGQVSVRDAQPHGAVFDVRLPLAGDSLGARL